MCELWNNSALPARIERGPHKHTYAHNGLNRITRPFDEYMMIRYMVFDPLSSVHKRLLPFSVECENRPNIKKIETTIVWHNGKCSKIWILNERMMVLLFFILKKQGTTLREMVRSYSFIKYIVRVLRRRVALPTY